MKKIFILLLITANFFGCGDKKETPDFKVEIEAKKLTNQKIKVEVVSNFPNDTQFTITASRGYKRHKNSENYAGELYLSRNSIVKNGLIEFDLHVNDQKWIKEYEELQKKYGKLEKTLTDINFSSVKDTIEIYVLYTPKGEQDKSVVKIVGEDGENLKGDGVENNGDFKTFERTIKIYNKFKK